MPGKKLVAPFAEEEYSLDLTRQNLVNWNLLYQQALPLSFPFIIPHATWKEKEYYIHHCPANISAEIVLEGSLQFTLEDGTRILRANELIFFRSANRTGSAPERKDLPGKRYSESADFWRSRFLRRSLWRAARSIVFRTLPGFCRCFLIWSHCTGNRIRPF